MFILLALPKFPSPQILLPPVMYDSMCFPHSPKGMRARKEYLNAF